MQACTKFERKTDAGNITWNKRQFKLLDNLLQPGWNCWIHFLQQVESSCCLTFSQLVSWLKLRKIAPRLEEGKQTHMLKAKMWNRPRKHSINGLFHLLSKIAHQSQLMQQIEAIRFCAKPPLHSYTCVRLPMCFCWGKNISPKNNVNSLCLDSETPW